MLIQRALSEAVHAIGPDIHLESPRIHILTEASRRPAL
jgi:hypothetical protein